MLVVGVLTSTAAFGASLNPDELKVVEARVGTVRPSAAKLSIAEGDTALLEQTIEVKGNRLAGRATDYEGLVTGVVGPDGVVVHNRLDSFEIHKTATGAALKVVYAIHVDPGAREGGRLRMNLTLVERKGLANVIVKSQVTHWIDVKKPTPTQRDLRADFEAYRLYAPRAVNLRRALAKRGLRLSLKDNGRMPPLNRANAKVTTAVFEYERARRRMWIAHRHLVAATKHPDPNIAAAARAYLSNLDKPQAQVSGLPAVSLLAQAAPPPPAPSKPADSGEMLEPTASEPAPPAGPTGRPGEVLAPVSTYDPNVERGAETSLPPSRAPRPDPEPEATPPPAPSKPSPAAAAPDEDDLEVRSDDPFLGNRRRYKRIPAYGRSLVLDDPNITHAAAFRAVYANVKVRENAQTAAFFFEGQVAFTRTFGLELTVPLEYVNVDVERARSVFAMGNPLIAAKWRLYLPKVAGRRPALTLRGRFGVPLAPLHSIPPTSLGAEEFTREAHFADTYAFFLEKADLGLGGSLAWKWNILRFGAQLYLDYFLPVRDALDQTDFLTLSWGASVGALPLGDVLGIYAEARAVSLLAGPNRTEFFTYLGVRSQFFDHFEPALWVGIPLGSVRTANAFTVGAEVRFAWDLYDVVDPGGNADPRDVPLL